MLSPYDPEETIPSDAKNGSPARLFDHFNEEKGSCAIINLRNFEHTQFKTAWGNLGEYDNTHYNIGQGKKSRISRGNTFFMVFVILNHGGSWNFLAKILH